MVKNEAFVLASNRNRSAGDLAFAFAVHLPTLPPMPEAESNFKKLRRHPIFPVLVFIVLASIIKENYPFSHFSMYSNPSKSVRYAFLADAEGKPLAILYHTGLSTSKVSKTLNKERGPLEDEAERAGKDPEVGEAKREIDRVAGERVLAELRKRSRDRAEKSEKKLGGERGAAAFDRFFLGQPIQLFETTVTVRDSQLVQDTVKIAKLPAEKK